VAVVTFSNITTFFKRSSIVARLIPSPLTIFRAGPTGGFRGCDNPPIIENFRFSSAKPKIFASVLLEKKSYFHYKNLGQPPNVG